MFNFLSLATGTTILTTLSWSNHELYSFVVFFEVVPLSILIMHVQNTINNKHLVKVLTNCPHYIKQNQCYHCGCCSIFKHNTSKCICHQMPTCDFDRINMVCPLHIIVTMKSRAKKKANSQPRRQFISVSIHQHRYLLWNIALVSRSIVKIHFEWQLQKCPWVEQQMSLLPLGVM